MRTSLQQILHDIKGIDSLTQHQTFKTIKIRITGLVCTEETKQGPSKNKSLG